MQIFCVDSKPQRLLLILLLWIAGTPSAAVAEAAVSSVSTTPTSPLTCPYRTINYITHSLPQQCLTFTRPSLSNVTATRANGSFDGKTGPPSTYARETKSTSVSAASTQTPKEQPSGSSSPSVVQSTTPAAGSVEDSDSESPLGKDNFLSFEEWKKRNLDKYGQSSDHIGKPKKRDSVQARRQPLKDLEALGDDGGIDLDFSSFASERPAISAPGQVDGPAMALADANAGREIPKARSRTKDAGTTYKERFNYASFDCAATILKTNAKSSGSSAVLVENKDSYMLNECSVENKFLILELCEDILIDTIVLANFEFFSSIFRTFRVSASDRYPVKPDKWKVLGEFEARNTREVQAFLVENPLIWTKYVRIEFLTHYGNEFYCPVSLVRVHGTTMLEDYRHDEEPNKAEDREEEEEQTQSPLEATPLGVPVAVAEVLVKEESLKTSLQDGSSRNVSMAIQDTMSMRANETASTSATSMAAPVIASSNGHSESATSSNASPFEVVHQLCQSTESNLATSMVEPSSHRSDHLVHQDTASAGQSTAARGEQGTLIPPNVAASSSRETLQPAPKTPNNNGSSEKTLASNASVNSSDRPGITSTDEAGADKSKPAGTPTQPPSSNPTVQESFFKSVQKRLQMLESNSTLSLQYIEEQSRILRDAFNKVEQRQLAKTTKFLDYLNDTVLNELRDFRQQYDQLWQSTIIELETQRERSQGEAVALHAQLDILTDELVFQKRMAAFQSILVLICIGLVLFSRGAVNSYLEHPLVQNMLSRSATLRMRGTLLDTPSVSPESTRPSSSYKSQAKAAFDTLRGHTRALSEESLSGAANPAVLYSPPTPASYDGHSDVEEQEGDHAVVGHSLKTTVNTQRSRSSPPVIHHYVDDSSTPTQTSAQAWDKVLLASSPASSSQSSSGGSSQLLDDESDNGRLSQPGSGPKR